MVRQFVNAQRCIPILLIHSALAKLQVTSKTRSLSEAVNGQESERDLLQFLYPQAKALSRVYSCCVYYKTEMEDLVCHSLDDECIAEFRQLMNMYYIWGACLFALSLLALTILMVHARVAKTKKGVLEQGKKQVSNYGLISNSGLDDTEEQQQLRRLKTLSQRMDQIERNHSQMQQREKQCMEQKLQESLSLGNILQGDESQKLMVELAVRTSVPKSKRRATRKLLLTNKQQLDLQAYADEHSKKHASKSCKRKKSKNHNSDDKRRKSVFVRKQEFPMANSVSSFVRSQSSVGKMIPLKHIVEEHGESDMSSIPSKLHTPMSVTESLEPTPSLSGTGTPERRAIATEPSEVTQQNTILSRTKKQMTNNNSQIMSLRTRGTYGIDSNSNRSTDHTFASLVKDFESMADSNQKTNNPQTASLEVIHEDFEIASNHIPSARNLGKKSGTFTRHGASHSFGRLEHINENQQTMEGLGHSATELHSSEHMVTDGPMHFIEGQQSPKDGRGQSLTPKGKTSSDRETPRAVSAIPNSAYRNTGLSIGDEEEINRQAGGDDSIDGKQTNESELRK